LDDVLTVFVHNLGLGRLEPQLAEQWRSLEDVLRVTE
jgi:hypothetical protein